MLLALLLCFVVQVSAQLVCNNSPALCERAFDRITHLGAHDSSFIRDASTNFTIAGDQYSPSTFPRLSADAYVSARSYNSTTQLQAGVRLLTTQLHHVTNSADIVEWRLCHTLCQIYNGGLVTTWLSSIKTWLDVNPHEVVTLLIVNSDNADAATLDGLFSTSGIKSYAYVPPETTQAMVSWPTLNQLIANNTRLVTFIASLDPANNTVAPYLLDEFTFVFENNYDVDNPADFSCDANRPSSLNGNTAGAISSGRMPLMNHFLYDNINGIEIPSIENVNNTNAPSGSVGNLGDAATNCTRVYGKAPTFILVDYFNVGPAIETVDRLNGVEGQTEGRLSLPTTVLESTSVSSQSSTSVSSTSSATVSTTTQASKVNSTSTVAIVVATTTAQASTPSSITISSVSSSGASSTSSSLAVTTIQPGSTAVISSQSTNAVVPTSTPSVAVYSPGPGASANIANYPHEAGLSHIAFLALGLFMW